MHVWVVKTAQHVPGLCLHYIKHKRLTLAGPILCTTFTWAHTTRSSPFFMFPPCRGTGENNSITLQHRADLMERTLKARRIQSLTWWILEERDDEEKECWREGGGIEGHGVRSSVYMTMESKWWHHIALEETVIQTTLINFSTSCHHTQWSYIQKPLI